MPKQFLPIHWFLAVVIIGLLSFVVGYVWPKEHVPPETYSVGPVEKPTDTLSDYSSFGLY